MKDTTLSHTYTTLTHNFVTHNSSHTTFKMINFSPSPLSLLLFPCRFNHFFWLLEEVDLWGYPVLYFFHVGGITLLYYSQSWPTQKRSSFPHKIWGNSVKPVFWTSFWTRRAVSDSYISCTLMRLRLLQILRFHGAWGSSFRAPTVPSLWISSTPEFPAQ